MNSVESRSSKQELSSSARKQLKDILKALDSLEVSNGRLAAENVLLKRHLILKHENAGLRVANILEQVLSWFDDTLTNKTQGSEKVESLSNDQASSQNRKQSLRIQDLMRTSETGNSITPSLLRLSELLDSMKSSQNPAATAEIKRDIPNESFLFRNHAQQSGNVEFPKHMSFDSGHQTLNLSHAQSSAEDQKSSGFVDGKKASPASDRMLNNQFAAQKANDGRPQNQDQQFTKDYEHCLEELYDSDSDGSRPEFIQNAVSEKRVSVVGDPQKPNGYVWTKEGGNSDKWNHDPDIGQPLVTSTPKPQSMKNLTSSMKLRQSRDKRIGQAPFIISTDELPNMTEKSERQTMKQSIDCHDTRRSSKSPSRPEYVSEMSKQEERNDGTIERLSKPATTKNDKPASPKPAREMALTRTTSESSKITKSPRSIKSNIGEKSQSRASKGRKAASDDEVTAPGSLIDTNAMPEMSTGYLSMTQETAANNTNKLAFVESSNVTKSPRSIEPKIREKSSTRASKGRNAPSDDEVSTPESLIGANTIPELSTGYLSVTQETGANNTNHFTSNDNTELSQASTEVPSKSSSKKADAYWKSLEPKRTRIEKFQPTPRLIGELAFQLDRRILNYVFNSVRHRGNKKRFYGYLVKNIPDMIKNHACPPDSKNSSEAMVSIMNYRYRYILYRLEPIGYNVNYHSDFCVNLVNKHGLLPAKAQTSILNTLPADESYLLRQMLIAVTPIDELSDVFILLDCLITMAREDKKPIFVW